MKPKSVKVNGGNTGISPDFFHKSPGMTHGPNLQDQPPHDVSTITGLHSKLQPSTTTVNKAIKITNTVNLFNFQPKCLSLLMVIIDNRTIAAMAGTDRSWLFVVRFGQFTAAFCYLVGALTGKSLLSRVLHRLCFPFHL